MHSVYQSLSKCLVGGLLISVMFGCEGGSAPSGSEASAIPSDPLPPVVDVTGTWSGTFVIENSREGAAQDTVFNLVQTGNNVTGFNEGRAVSGVVSGDQLWLTLVWDDGGGLVAGTVAGNSVTLHGKVSLGNGTFAYDAPLSRK